MRPGDNARWPLARSLNLSDLTDVDAALINLTFPQGGAAGYALVKTGLGDFDWEWAAVSGTPGPAGTGAGIEYMFSSTITMADPGDGYWRADSATAASVTALAISSKDVLLVSRQGYIATWDDSTATAKGSLFVIDETGDAFVFAVTSVDNNTGWRQINGTRTSGSLPANGATTHLFFVPTGDIGPAGTPADVHYEPVRLLL